MARLQVNVDHVATVRQARRAAEPDPIQAAVLCELAGATGITVHLREDRRHIQDRDVELLRRTVKTRLNLEMAASAEMAAIALAVRPDQITLVPEKRQELTTEGGLDALGLEAQITPYVGRLNAAGLPVSLFIAHDRRQIDAAKRIGASAIEIHTGAYADATTEEVRRRELASIASGVEHALGLGLTVHVGHGLDYRNVDAIAAIPGIDELNIGFSIVGRAVLVGITEAVREMVARIEVASGGRKPAVRA